MTLAEVCKEPSYCHRGAPDPPAQILERVRLPRPRPREGITSTVTSEHVTSGEESTQSRCGSCAWGASQEAGACAEGGSSATGPQRAWPLPTGALSWGAARSRWRDTWSKLCFPPTRVLLLTTSQLTLLASSVKTVFRKAPRRLLGPQVGFPARTPTALGGFHGDTTGHSSRGGPGPDPP